VDPESALRRTNLKFERRFRTIETTLEAQGRSPLDASLDEMEQLWIAAKAAERELG
jgi:ATP diphosphatase